MSLTDVFIRNKTKPQAVQKEYSDKQNGLALAVYPSGVKSWIVRYRSPVTTKPSKITIGPADRYSLAEARAVARELMVQVDRGVDPLQARKATKDAAAERAENTVAGVADLYFRLEGPKLRSRAHREGVFRNHILPALGTIPMDALSRRDVVKLLDDVELRTSPIAANLVLAHLSKLLNWHAVRNESFRSPLVRGMSRGTNPRRAHTLADDEIRALWRACEKWDVPHAHWLQFLLLTCSRRNEAGHMTWSEIVGTEWTVPAARYKTKIDHLTPLSGAAQAILAKCPRFVGGYVFGMRGLENHQRIKAEADRRMAVKLGRVPNPWRLHDLRRTARTLMSRIGVSADVAERCLGHLPPGIVRTYNQHDFKAEKAAAFEALAAEIRRIVKS